MASDGLRTAGAEAGIYPFLPLFVMDISHSTFFNLRTRERVFPLSTCTDGETFCLESKEFKVSLPRSCAARERFFEAEGGPIVASYTRRTHLQSFKSYAYFDPKYPHYAFLVGREGLIGVLYHPLAENLGAMLRTEMLERPDLGVNEMRYSHGELISRETLFACA